MTNPTPELDINSEISSLQSEISTLHTKVRLSSIRDEIGDLTAQAGGLLEKIKGLRAQNYVFEKGLEEQANNIASRWMSMHSSIEMQVTSEAMRLESEVPFIESQVQRLISYISSPSAARPVIAQIRTSVSNLESKAGAAENAIRGAYSAFANEVKTLVDHLDKVAWTVTQLNEASFSLLNTEGVIMAVKATWIDGGKEDKDDPQGVLFLTDQRLIFEQKQEIATKKVLFVTTAKEKVQKVIFEVPVTLVNKIVPTKQGLFKNEDHIQFEFASGAPKPNAHLHISGQDCNLWQVLIKRAKEKDFDGDRAIKVPEQELEKVKQAPAICPQCGGTIKQTVLRGQDSITCEYCGFVIRL